MMPRPTFAGRPAMRLAAMRLAALRLAALAVAAAGVLAAPEAFAQAPAIPPPAAAAPMAAAPAAVPPAAVAGVPYTEEQAARGKAVYDRSCVDCHGPNLDDGEFGGPPLKGLAFEAKWFGLPISDLYGFMAAAMPPDRPGALGPDTYAALLAHILNGNGFPAGSTELPHDIDALAAIDLVRPPAP